MDSTTPTVSVVVPIHNEEAILADQVSAMIRALRSLAITFELLLVENGSTDQTLTIGKELANELPEIRVFSLPVGDYGLALKQGILEAANEVVVIVNVEFWSEEFVRIALAALQSRSIIIGSKSAPGTYDERPLLRKLVTYAYNQMLRWLWGFDGTDTHGMKAFWREPIVALVSECATRGWIFDTELVLRTQRAGMSKLELPTDAREIRAPSYKTLARRVPSVLRDLWILSCQVPIQPVILGSRTKR